MRDRALVIYTAGQVSAVASRPLVLFLTNNYLSKNTVDGLAVVFLASALSLAAIAASPHQRFYPRHFGTVGPVNGLPFFLYAASVAMMIGLGGVLTFAIGIGLTGSLVLVAAGCAYFVSEKLADEVLRFRLFDDNLGGWGGAAILRAVLQLSGLALLIILMGRTTPAWLEVMLLTSGNLVVFLPQVPRNLWTMLSHTRVSVLVWLAKRAWRWLCGNWTLWVLALLASGVAYLDRCIAVFVDRDLFPLFMLVSMCFSVAPMMVGAYYLNRNRRAFLDRRLTAAMVLTSWQFLGLLSAGLLGGVIVCAAALAFSPNGDGFPVSYLLVIAALQLLAAVINALWEIPYWHGSITLMIRVEGLFCLLVGFTLLIGWWAHLDAVWIFTSVIGCVIVRLAAYLAISLPLSPLRAGVCTAAR